MLSKYSISKPTLFRKLTFSRILVSSAMLALTSPPSAAETVTLTTQWAAPLLQSHPLVGKIIRLHDHRTLSSSELINDLAPIPVVLIGEKHDNDDHHLIERWLIEHLFSNGGNRGDPSDIKDKRTTSLVLEMLTDEQPTADINAHMTDVERQTQLKWNNNNWPWKDYGPSIQSALIRHFPLLSGNISRNGIMQIYQHGIPANERFDSTVDIPNLVKAQIKEQVYESHCQLMPRDTLTPMVDVQLARDASLASAIKSRTTDNAILIAGSFHVNKSMGVPLHLDANQPNQTWKTLQLVEVTKSKTQVDDYINQSTADYVWFTPKQSDKDYCDDMRSQLKKKPTSP